MAQTISELEKERAELLRKIEEEARLAKQQNGRGGAAAESKNETELSLNDFLKAAQEVIPDEAAPILSDPAQRNAPAGSTAANSTSSHQGKQAMINSRTKVQAQAGQMGRESQPSQTASTSSQKSTFFGVVIMLTLLLTVLGVMGLIYITLKESIDQLDQNSQSQEQSMIKIAQEVKQLQSNQGGSGNGENFNVLKLKVEQLEKKVYGLEAELQKLQSQPMVTSEEIPKLKVPGDTVITADLLDQKFTLYTQYLGKRLDGKLDLILRYLATEKAADLPSKPEQSTAPTKSEPYQLPRHVKEADEPKVVEPKQPKTEKTLKPTEPVVTLVKPATQPIAPNKPSTHYTEDSKWLAEQPLFNYTLQLASMVDKNMLQRFKQRKKLDHAKIIPQKRGEKVRYVLIEGSYATRSEAKNRARQLNQEVGISPWIRKVKDLTSRLP